MNRKRSSLKMRINSLSNLIELVNNKDANTTEITILLGNEQMTSSTKIKLKENIEKLKCVFNNIFKSEKEILEKEGGFYGV